MTGFLAEQGERDSLAGAIERAIANADRWPSIGTSARSHVTREFDATTQGRRLAELYQQIAR